MVVVRARCVEGGAKAKGVVSIGGHDEITGFTTGEAESEEWVNSGLYVLERGRVATWPAGSYDLEPCFGSLVPRGQGRAFRSEGSLLDIGTPECYAWAAQTLRTSGHYAR